MKRVTKATCLGGSIRVPGDKSISHRAIMMGVLARSPVTVTGAAWSADINSTISCVRQLGCNIRIDGDSMHLEPGPAPSQVALDAGNSGTTARLLSGIVAGMGITGTIDGDASLRTRPMARIATPLFKMGASIQLGTDDHLPIQIEASALRGVRYQLPVSSAQVKSAILFAGLFAKGTTTVVEPVPTRDHTERMLSNLGINIDAHDGEISIKGGQHVSGGHINVPGDFSSAAYFVVAAAAHADAKITIQNVGVNPTRIGLLKVLRKMGADIVINNICDSEGEPYADIVVRSAQLNAVDLDDPATIASVIDEIPIIAIAAATASGKTVIRNAGELRHKESDRIATTAAMLDSLGIEVETFEDGLSITGGQMTGATIQTGGDHRIAMAGAIAGILANGETSIDEADAVGISYPEFFDHLATLTR